MRSIFKAVFVAFLAVIALSAVAASAAFAASPAWETETGKVFSTFTKPLTVESNVTLRIEEPRGGPSGEALYSECTGVVVGTVGSTNGKEGKIETIENMEKTSNIIDCKVIEGNCGGVSEWSAGNLPWNTELFLEGAEIRDKIKSAVKKEIIWEKWCGGLKQICGLSEASTHMENNTTTGNVEAVFDSKSGWGNDSCVWKGKGAAVVTGTITIKHPKGIEAIRVK